jgi:hypothetical protein
MLALGLVTEETMTRLLRQGFVPSWMSLEFPLLV